jgi:hypothetical protein
METMITRSVDSYKLASTFRGGVSFSSFSSSSCCLYF